MLEELSLKDLKAKFSALTQLPARKIFVLLACPSLDGCAMRSKEDWRKAIESIEFKLAPSLEDSGDVESQPVQREIPQAQPSDPLSVEVETVLKFLSMDKDPRTVFYCSFYTADDQKRLYRKLAQRFHPDVNQDEDDGLFKELNSVYEEILLEQQSESQQSEASVQRRQYTEEDYQEGGTAWWNSASLDEVLRYQLGDDYASFRW
jgi:hypothetical protein